MSLRSSIILTVKDTPTFLLLFKVPTETYFLHNFITISVADAAFSREGRQSREGWLHTIIWRIFPEKLHENENNRTKRGIMSKSEMVGPTFAKYAQ